MMNFPYILNLFIFRMIRSQGEYVTQKNGDVSGNCLSSLECIIYELKGFRFPIGL